MGSNRDTKEMIFFARPDIENANALLFDTTSKIINKVNFFARS